ncbi:MAG: GUN4 domain-containing protein [Cyanobacteria bacterium]|nr:GUN4 domain-containing protein [Cyanobacteriota bacterium]
MGIGQKFALLIGVGDYAEDSGLKGLSTPTRNVAALAEVLGNEAVGGFAVTPLLNPTQVDMSRAISDLFYSRDREDLLLLYFSGHGITDEERRLYLSNRETRKYADGTLNKGTAISANTIKDMMGSPLHRRVMVVLDCCFAGAFGEGILTMDDQTVDVAAALGGQGRVVLTAADSMGYALEESDHELSVYTRYFHEGLVTGAAASEGSEWISARMLHDYVATRVRLGGYAMKPEIYVEKDGCGIYVARAKPGDPEVRYRRECAEYFDDSCGIFPSAAVKLLERKATGLGITPERAAELREAVRRPWVEYRENLREYRLALAEDLTHYGMQLPEVARRALAALRQELSLKDEDADAINVKLMAAVPASTKEIVKPVTAPAAVELSREEAPQPATEPTPPRYQKLEELLAAGDWKGADQETRAVMLAVANRKEQGWLDEDSINEFPCEDLRAIDGLWVRYSQGKFGFSVQKEIYVACGAKLDAKNPSLNIWRAFGDRVGWRLEGWWINWTSVYFYLDGLNRGTLPGAWFAGDLAGADPGDDSYSARLKKLSNNQAWLRSARIFSRLTQRLVARLNHQ